MPGQTKTMPDDHSMQDSHSGPEHSATTDIGIADKNDARPEQASVAKTAGFLHRKDLLLLLAVLIVAGVWQLINSLCNKPSSGELYACIFVDGEEYSSLPLSEEASIRVPGYGGMSCLVNITSKRADVTEADCPDKLCVHQKSIGSIGETIVCLPARIVVEIKGEEQEENEYDAFSQ